MAIRNVSPRPYVPGCPMRLNCRYDDLLNGGAPTVFDGTPIPDGSKLRILDKDKTYIFDADNGKWYPWTQDGGGSGGGGGGGDIATDSEVDEALDTVFPN